ncbi:MAG: hypothetical protein KIS81_00590 [Maricaulaceae bacterium]|nr:hypothetical protein [Maricaulaceae bacterium]
MPPFQSARWADPEQTWIIALDADGAEHHVPAAPGNSDFRLITQGRPANHGDPAIEPLEIDDYEPA